MAVIWFICLCLTDPFKKKNIDRLVCFAKTSYFRVSKSTNTVDTQERILSTACRLFYTQGYNSTGINQIIDEAKVAKASLYQYFPSKENLLAEYLRIAAEDTNKTLQAAVDKQKTVKDKVIAVFDFLLKRTRQPEFNGCDFLNIVSEVPKENKMIRAIIKKQKDHIRSLFAEILEPEGKEALADEFYLLFDAALISGRVYGDAWPAKVSKNIAAKLL
jgi:AcrR family transcriptional regulator